MSTRFVFRLASVLRHRRRLEDLRAREMRAATERHEAAHARQQALEHRAEAERATLVADAVGGLSGAALRMRADGVRDAATSAHAARAVTAAAAAHVEDQRTALVEAARARRILERLEEVRRDAWRAEANHAEQRTNDDITTTRRGANR